MDHLEIRLESGAKGATSILRLEGPLNLSTLSLLQRTLQEIGSVDTIIDVAQVPYIDSAGLATILSRWAQAQNAGRKFAVTGVSPRIEALLEVTKVNTVMPMFKTAEEADERFGERSAKA